MAKPSAKGLGRSASHEGLIAEPELDEIERSNPEGLSSAQVVEMFRRHGLKLSEATFRKYVQLGLLPRSRRVGRKGKHQGSMGLYPATVVRRLNAIRRMMGESYTIEEIQRTFLRFTEQLEALERALTSIFTSIDSDLGQLELEASKKRKLERSVEECKHQAEELVERLAELERVIVAPLERAARARAFSTGTSGGAGDLL